MEDAYWYYVATVGDFFGAWGIGKYNIKRIQDMMCPKSQVNYKCKEMYDLSKDPKWCEKDSLIHIITTKVIEVKKVVII